MPLHPAENRGYRELFLTAHQARTRLMRLAAYLDGEPATAVAKAHEELAVMLGDFEPALARYQLHAEHAAGGNGARLGLIRAAVLDRFLERNQALRLAVDDLEHVTTLLAYLGGVSGTRLATELTELCERWERRIRRQVRAVRRATVELGSDPDGAIVPVDRSPAGRAAHAAAVVVGTLGEAFDRVAAAAGRRFGR
jgi:hypothetical protein